MANKHLASAVFLVVSLTGLSVTAQVVDPQDRACGSRCVSYVLDALGDHEHDLPDIVREIQHGDPDQPATLSSIASFLEQRQYHHITLTSADLADVADSGLPVIAHVPYKLSGHFFVIHGSARDSATSRHLSHVYLLDGATRADYVATEQLEELDIDAVMLVSTDADTLSRASDSIRGRYQRPIQTAALIGFAASVVLIFGAFVIQRLHRWRAVSTADQKQPV